MSEPTDETPLKPMGASSGEEATPPEGKATEVEDAPPKYAKALGIAKIQKEMKTAKDGSSNNATLLFKVCGILFDSGATLACLLPLAALAIAMIVIGALNKDNCPGQRFIPIWLIVFGSFSLFQLVTNCLRTLCACCCCRNGDDDDEEGSKKKGNGYANRGGGCCECIISLFLFAWLIVGSVWVFRYHSTFYSEHCQTNLGDCCAALPYLFSFWSIVAIYALSVLALIATCCCLCCCICCFIGVGAAAASSK